MSTFKAKSSGKYLLTVRTQKLRIRGAMLDLKLAVELVSVYLAPMWFRCEGMNGPWRAVEAWCLVAGLELPRKSSERPLVKPQTQWRPQDLRDFRVVGYPLRTVEGESRCVLCR